MHPWTQNLGDFKLFAKHFDIIRESWTSKWKRFLPSNMNTLIETPFNVVFLLLCLVFDGKQSDHGTVIHSKMFLRHFVCQQTHKIHRWKNYIIPYLLAFTREVKCTVYFMLAVQLKEQFTQNRHRLTHCSALSWCRLWMTFSHPHHSSQSFTVLVVDFNIKTKQNKKTCLRTTSVMPKCPKDTNTVFYSEDIHCSLARSRVVLV